MRYFREEGGIYLTEEEALKVLKEVKLEGLSKKLRKQTETTIKKLEREKKRRPWSVRVEDIRRMGETIHKKKKEGESLLSTQYRLGGKTLEVYEVKGKHDRTSICKECILSEILLCEKGISIDDNLKIAGNPCPGQKGKHYAWRLLQK